MPKMLAYPSYKPGMNILCDIRATPLPEVFNFKYVKNSHPSEMSHIEQQLGKCKIAVVVGNAKNFATIHQLIISTRLTPAKISKKPFRDLSQAKASLGIPEDYKIKYLEHINNAV